MNDTWAGIATLAGVPNVGKSTLLNAFVGEKLSIVTPKPQTTWQRVTGIYSGEAHQIVFIDTPGLFAARDLFHRGMVETACRAVEDADVVLVVVDATSQRKPTPWAVLLALVEQTRAPRLVAVNKIDAAPAAAVDGLVSEAACRLNARTFPVSALHGTGVVKLREALEAELPQSPFLFPRDQIASDSVRFFVAELVRETVFELYDQEIPYSVSCRLEQFREDKDPVYIQATLYVERSSQKGILIGDGGRAIRELGSRARTKIERFVGQRVYLDLWVKVLAGWRRKRVHLRRLGFAVPLDHETKRVR
jgi:GTP-binding protein Era